MRLDGATPGLHASRQPERLAPAIHRARPRKGLAALEYLIIIATVILPLTIVINRKLIPALVAYYQTSAFIILLPFP